MASLEQIFDDERRRQQREDNIRNLEDEITKDVTVREYRQFRENRHLLISGPEAGPGEYTYSDCRIARESAERGEYPVTLMEYRAEVEFQRERSEQAETLQDYRIQRGQE